MGGADPDGSYRAVTYSSGEFTCYDEGTGRIAPPFDPHKLANNHLVPRFAADAATYAWGASLGVFVALAVVWLARPPFA